MRIGALVRFTVHEDGTATGQTLPMGVGFMEVRPQRTTETSDTPIDRERHGSSESRTAIDPGPLLADPATRWALAVALPRCRYGTAPFWLRDPVTDAWASVMPETDGGYLVRQHGPRRLWDEAEAAYRWWQRHGRPGTTDWEWHVAKDSQTIRVPPPGDV